jgi:DNA-binding NarL/FixJ family response regulator
MELQSDVTRARSLLEASLAGAKDLGDAWSIARASNALGEIARGEGDFDRAVGFYTEALRLFRMHGHSKHTPLVLHNLGQLATLRGDAPQGTAHFAEALALQQDLGDRRGQAFSLSGLAATAALMQQAERAARLFGAADGLVAQAGVVLEALDVAIYARHRQAARAALGAAAFSAAWDAGRALPLAEACAEAMAFARDVAGTLASSTTRPESPAPGLSRRERDVLRLLVEGHSNPAIAAALFISPKTVRNHVTAILAKLGVETRTAAATFALRHGLD